jgi:antitoxin component of MazEF toxin-antitoxin module
MAAVATWGRSLAVRFPKDIVEKLMLDVGDEVEFPEKDGVISIRKKTRKRPSLDDLLATVPDDYASVDAWAGIDKPVGSEAW